MEPLASSRFHLRAMRASDSEMITRLITEFDGDLTTLFLVDAYQAIISGTENRTLGVVAECAGQEDLVGMGTMRFSEVQFNGVMLPLAFLDGLKVHAEFRGQGLGFQIAQWRFQQAREQLGERCVIATGLLQENRASYAVAKKWCREFIDPAVEALIMPVRGQQPKSPGGLSVSLLEPGQYEEFADQQNRFFQAYNFYPPNRAALIDHAMAVEVDRIKPYRFFTAVDSRGNLLAGAKTWARGLLKTDRINKIPAPLQALNKILHILPADNTLRETAVNGLWYKPGHEQAARFLWQVIRWTCRDRGAPIVISLDPRDPVREILEIKPWHQPRPKVTLAIHGPEEIDRERLIYSEGRV